MSQESSNLDKQSQRIMKILGAKDEVPNVEESGIRDFMLHLKTALEQPCILTGIEDMGVFSWEERYMWGGGSKAEHKRRRKNEPSFKDTYKLLSFEDVDPYYGILVNVQRTTDNKKFTLPLADLEAKDKKSKNFQHVEDYVIWFVNWR